jgi:hypothetical protein
MRMRIPEPEEPDPLLKSLAAALQEGEKKGIVLCCVLKIGMQCGPRRATASFLTRGL